MFTINKSLFMKVVFKIFTIVLLLGGVIHALNLESQEYICNEGASVVVLIVDPDLHIQIETGLNQFEEDLCGENYSVIEVVYDFTDPIELRNYLSLLYAATSAKLEGAIFIGSIPWVYQKVIPPSDPQSFGYEVISFQYYSDLDGEFDMSPGYSSYGNYDYSFDLHSGDVDWEIWCSNLPYYKGDLNITIEAINRYFEKNHAYRTGNFDYQSNFVHINEHHQASSIAEHNTIVGWYTSGTYAWTPLSELSTSKIYFDTVFNGQSLQDGYEALTYGESSFTVHDCHGWIGGAGGLSIEWLESNPVKTTFFWSGGCSVGNLDYDDLWLRSVVYSPTSDVLFAYGSTNSSGGIGTNTNGFYGRNIATQLTLGGNFGQSLMSHINVPLIDSFIDDREFYCAQPVIIGDPTLKLPSVTSLNTSETNSLPDKIQVLPNYPNPFNPSTTITYGLSEDSDVKISIYDLSGKLIKTLLNKKQLQGWHSIEWNGTDQHNNQVPAGIYLSRITSNNTTKTSKLMLLK